MWQFTYIISIICVGLFVNENALEHVRKNVDFIIVESFGIKCQNKLKYIISISVFF